MTFWVFQIQWGDKMNSTFISVTAVVEFEGLSLYDIKSVNLQYNTLVCWADGTNNSSTKCLMFQVFFFHKILQNSLQKPFQFIFIFFYKITKMKIKSFECPKSIKNCEKKILGTSDTWSLGRSSKRTSKPAYYIED